MPVHKSVYSYRKEISLKHHALAHRHNNFITRLDFRNFFNSIDSDDILIFITDNKEHISDKWSTPDTELFIKLTTFKGALTIGSVTSPLLSNSICYALDEQVSNICCELKVKYTRYADDLYFSTNEKQVLFSIAKHITTILRGLSYPKSLWLNKKKTIHTSRKRLRRVTGVVLTPAGKVSVGRDKKRKVRTLVYQWATLTPKEKLSLQGYLSFVSSIEPEFINSLCSKYGSKTISDIISYK